MLNLYQRLKNLWRLSAYNADRYDKWIRDFMSDEQEILIKKYIDNEVAYKKKRMATIVTSTFNPLIEELPKEDVI